MANLRTRSRLRAMLKKVAPAARRLRCGERTRLLQFARRFERVPPREMTRARLRAELRRAFQGRDGQRLLRRIRALRLRLQRKAAKDGR